MMVTPLLMSRWVMFAARVLVVILSVLRCCGAAVLRCCGAAVLQMFEPDCPGHM
jgi:hypothetical protein